MTQPRTVLAATAVSVVIAGAAAFFLMSGDDPVISVSASRNTLRFEAAAIEYAGWPEMRVRVNGEQVALIKIENATRSMYELDVPGSVGDIKTVEASIVSESDCKAAVWIQAHECTDRTITIRGLYVDDEKIEGQVAGGKKNKPWSIQSEDGAITWTVGG